jgi:uncharacterized FAD-dependent dehydrogenase
MSYTEKIVIVGGGVAGIAAATKLVDNGYPGNLITIIDVGLDPYNRPDNEVMKGFAGAGLKSDGKLVYKHNEIGGHLSKYCGETKATQLVEESLSLIKRFHPDPEKIMFSNPKEEPEFIKPYFDLRMAPTWHIGTDYLDILGKNWYNWLINQKINFKWGCEVTNINFINNVLLYLDKTKGEGNWKIQPLPYDKLIYCTGKSGIDLTQRLITNNFLETEPKNCQIGVRFEAPQKYFQKLVDISYDFKLYQKPNDKVSVRSFCTNNNMAYIAVEETYGDISYNGHSKGNKELYNGMTNFGILMEIKNIENPFEWSRKLVMSCQRENKGERMGLYYSPNKTRTPSKTSEGIKIKCYQLEDLEAFKCYGEYYEYIINFINDMNKVFNFGDDWGIYIPEIKYLSPEILVNYKDLSLKQYSNVYFAGDSLSARGIIVSLAQSLYLVESILN